MLPLTTDINQLGTHAFATKQGKERTTFSYKITFEATEEKLKINGTGNFQYMHGCVCIWEKYKQQKFMLLSL